MFKPKNHISDITRRKLTTANPSHTHLDIYGLPKFHNVKNVVTHYLTFGMKTDTFPKILTISLTF